jgi:NAD(P)-dependent dehydrogenase (short-subunit alcohol dehydrogenase family)
MTPEAMFDLSGKVVLVTGGNSGIGLAIAQAVAEAGAEVCIWGRSPDKNATALSALHALGGAGAATTTQAVDIGDEAQVVAGMAALAEAHGRLDCCFANASAPTTGDRPAFVDSSTDDWRAVMSVVLDGTYVTLREASKLMVASGGGGSLVATSSAAAHYGVPRGQAYSAAKAAVHSLVRGLAVELARHGIRANTISPAWVKSAFMDGIDGDEEMTRRIQARIALRRWAEPSELAGIAVYLASDASSWHTGTEFVLDGGYSVV